MRCELNSFSVLIPLCRKVFSLQFFSTINPKLYRGVSADSILETIKQIMFTFLQVGLMKDDLTAYVCFHVCCICVRDTYSFM